MCICVSVSLSCVVVRSEGAWFVSEASSIPFLWWGQGPGSACAADAGQGLLEMAKDEQELRATLRLLGSELPSTQETTRWLVWEVREAKQGSELCPWLHRPGRRGTLGCPGHCLPRRTAILWLWARMALPLRARPAASRHRHLPDAPLFIAQASCQAERRAGSGGILEHRTRRHLCLP